MSDQPAESDDLLPRLGGIVVLWAHVENWLGELLAFLLEANPALMHVVTDNVSSSTICDWIRTLLQAPNMPIEPPDVLALLGDIDKLRAERNALIHGTWAFDEPGTALVRTIKWSRAEVINDTVVTALDLEELAAEITDALNRLRELGGRYGFPVVPE
jgi:hypothetical protein